MLNKRFLKKIAVYFLDIINCVLATYLAYALRLDTFFLKNVINIEIIIFPIVLFTLIFYYFNFYTSVFRYLDTQLNSQILKVFSIYFIINALGILYFNIQSNIFAPRSIIILQPIFFYFFYLFSRYVISNYIFGSVLNNKSIANKKRVIIIGVNKRSVDFVKFLNTSSNVTVCSFIDENNNSKNQTINNIPINNYLNLKDTINNYKITDIYVAIDNLDETKKNKIFNELKNFHIRINFLPIENNNLDFSQIKFTDINFDEIIFPKKVKLNINKNNKFFSKKIIAISGAAGSIGSNLTYELLKFNIKKIILIDKDEYGIFKLKKKIDQIKVVSKKKIRTEYCLADVSDFNFVKKIFKNQINIFYHAAAYKHVALLENNFLSGIKNNIKSTLNLCNFASKNKIDHFCLISSDKAVRPKSVMGMTKKICEDIVLYHAKRGHCKFFSVRFGNVINSSGSVIPIFKNQIDNRVSLTVTSKKATRYFMHIIDAVKLVIESTTISQNSKIYALDMGQPIKIYDLAKKMIELSGFRFINIKKKFPDTHGLGIKIIGLKKGEKVKEEIFLGKKLKKSVVEKINIETEYQIPNTNYIKKIKILLNMIDQDDDKKTLKFFNKLASS